MSRILVVGNIIRDNYIKIDEHSSQLPLDQTNTPHLDLIFDGKHTTLFHSTFATFGGAAVTLEVLQNLGLKPRFPLAESHDINNLSFDFESAVVDNRFILNHLNNATYFSPSDMSPTIWRAPKEPIDTIYIDRSAKISPELVSNVTEYLTKNPNVKLYVFIGSRHNQHGQHIKDLVARANFIITDTKLVSGVANLTITEDKLTYQKITSTCPHHKKQNLLTHLTTHLIIAATIIAAKELSVPDEQALLLACANIKNATLSGSMRLSQLEAIVQGQEYQIENTENMNNMNEIQQNAQKLLAHPKGILAADESGGSINKKFASLNIEDTEQNRRDYRNLFFTTPDLEKYVNGVILFDETARQFADDGSNFIEFLAKKGIMPGIKVDQGLENLPNSEEKYTKGLEGLPERLSEYYKMGARFAKWRAAFEISEITPSDSSISKNAKILAQYARDCQDAGIVPIVEPEVVYDGDYSIEKNIYTTTKILDQLFLELSSQKIDLSACILKVNMILAGKKYHTSSPPQEVGKATAKVLIEHVPANLAGIVFLSGGQSVEQATDNLQAITNAGAFPWPLTFSFARALQDPALFAWRGDNNNADLAREAFRLRLIANTKALKRQ